MTRYSDLKYLEKDGFYIDLFEFSSEDDGYYYEDSKYCIDVTVRHRTSSCDEWVTTLATYEFASEEEAEKWIADFWSGEYNDPCIGIPKK